MSDTRAEAKVGTWQPIEDDVFIESKGWRIVVGYVGSNDDALFIEEHCQDGIYTHAVFELRANIRLCQLVDVPDAGGAPDWADAPDWANFWAVDDNGCSYWYEYKPILGIRIWLAERGSNEICKQYPGWRNTLQARPRAGQD